jgi:hypothetical protein
MLKASFKFFGVILAFAAVVASFFYESNVQQMLPFFRADVFLSGVLLIAGCSLSIFIRHMGIFVASVAMAFAIPFLVDWFVQYWPYVSSYYFSS